MNYNIFKSGGYFLTTLTPGAVCQVYSGTSCRSSNNQPMGVFKIVGTSFNLDNNAIYSFLIDPIHSPIINIFSKAIPDLSQLPIGG
jgi:hypothetical protein